MLVWIALCCFGVVLVSDVFLTVSSWFNLFQLVLTCSGCAVFLKLFENVIGSFELSGLVHFVASCCRLLQLVVCACRLFRMFRLVPSYFGQCEVANVLKVVFSRSRCLA